MKVGPKTHQKRSKNRIKKRVLVFDEKKRAEFLTGFHKRKLQRRKQAQEQFEKDLKEERKRLKAEAKDNYKKLVVSHRPIPELENLLKEEYEDGDVNVKVEELSTSAIATQSNWIGANQPKEDIEESEEEDVFGLSLKSKKTVKQTEKKQFQTEKDVKKALKKQATKNVKKSKVFQQKNIVEKQKQKKKAMKVKKQKMKVHEKGKFKKKH